MGSYHDSTAVAATASMPSSSCACYHSLTFTSGSSFSSKDFGNWQTSSVSGTKFNDLNGDGIQQATDPFFFNDTATTEIYTLSLHDALPIFDVTAASGTYSISGIKPGAFKVREVPQLNWTCSYPNAGAGDADANSGRAHACTSVTPTFTIPTSSCSKDFGNWQTSSVSGPKFTDLNCYGIHTRTTPVAAFFF